MNNLIPETKPKCIYCGQELYWYNTTYPMPQGLLHTSCYKPWTVEYPEQWENLLKGESKSGRTTT